MPGTAFAETTRYYPRLHYPAKHLLPQRTHIRAKLMPNRMQYSHIYNTPSFLNEKKIAILQSITKQAGPDWI